VFKKIYIYFLFFLFLKKQTKMDIALESWHTYSHIVKHLGWSILAFSRGDSHGEKTLRMYINKTNAFTGMEGKLTPLKAFLNFAFDTSKHNIKRKQYTGVDIEVNKATSIRSTLFGLHKWHDHAFQHFGKVIVEQSVPAYQLYAEHLGVLYQSLKTKKEIVGIRTVRDDLDILMHNVLVLIACVSGKRLSELSSVSYLSRVEVPSSQEFSVDEIEDESESEIKEENLALDEQLAREDAEKEQSLKRQREHLDEMDVNMNAWANAATEQIRVNQRKIQLHNNLFSRGSEQAPWAAKI
jgi:hypothetical protein